MDAGGSRVPRETSSVSGEGFNGLLYICTARSNSLWGMFPRLWLTATTGPPEASGDEVMKGTASFRPGWLVLTACRITKLSVSVPTPDLHASIQSLCNSLQRFWVRMSMPKSARIYTQVVASPFCPHILHVSAQPPDT